MNELQELNQFDGIRKHVDEAGEIWYVVVDVVESLIQSADPKNYWRVLKKRQPELITHCNEFRIKHRTNGRRYKTDCAQQEGILHIIQLIPSPKAAPFRKWLAMTGSRRLDEIKNDPIEAKREELRLLGYSEKEIEHRLTHMRQHGLLRGEWQQRGVTSDQSEILTDEIHKGTFDGLTRADHADLKQLDEGDNLHDHLTGMEVAFNILGEAAALDEIETQDPIGYDDNKEVAQKAGDLAGKHRKIYEKETGRQVISDRSPIKERNKQLPSAGDDEGG